MQHPRGTLRGRRIVTCRGTTRRRRSTGAIRREVVKGEEITKKARAAMIGPMAVANPLNPWARHNRSAKYFGEPRTVM